MNPTNALFGLFSYLIMIDLLVRAQVCDARSKIEPVTPTLARQMPRITWKYHAKAGSSGRRCLINYRPRSAMSIATCLRRDMTRGRWRSSRGSNHPHPYCSRRNLSASRKLNTATGATGAVLESAEVSTTGRGADELRSSFRAGLPFLTGNVVLLVVAQASAVLRERGPASSPRPV